jgi:hypothetical protein
VNRIDTTKASTLKPVLTMHRNIRFHTRMHGADKTRAQKNHSRSPMQRMPIHEVSTLKHAEKPSASAPKLWQ